MAQRYELATRLNPDTDEREWALSIRRYSRVRDAALVAATYLCSLTGHYFEHQLVGRAWEWADRKDRRLILVPITEDDAFLVDAKWVVEVKREDREEREDDED